MTSSKNPSLSVTYRQLTKSVTYNKSPSKPKSPCVKKSVKKKKNSTKKGKRMSPRRTTRNLEAKMALKKENKSKKMNLRNRRTSKGTSRRWELLDIFLQIKQ